MCWYLFCYALLCVNSSFAIILKRKRTLIAMLLLSYRRTVTINGMWLFLAVPWFGLQCVIVEFLIILTFCTVFTLRYVLNITLYKVDFQIKKLSSQHKSFMHQDERPFNSKLIEQTQTQSVVFCMHIGDNNTK